MVSYPWEPDVYARNARYVADLATDAVGLLAPRADERILDLGCGDGELTQRLADCGCEVVGVDANPEMIEAAHRRGLDARLMDGEALTFDREFDAVFSNQALHWMRRPDRVIEGVWRALRGGGRFVAECGGQGCIDTIVAALYAALSRRGIDGSRLNPWYFPSPEDYRTRLTNGGFHLECIQLTPRPTPLPGDISGWMETFAHSFTSALAPSERAEFAAEVREELRPKLFGADGRWTADYMLLRFAASKPLMTSPLIEGYAYGAQHLARSPISLDELGDLERAIGFDRQSARDLHELWGVLTSHLDELVAIWIAAILPFVRVTFAGPDGVEDRRYLEAVLSRFTKWIEDTCIRRYDQAWLDYQHEIGNRHHRAKKNQTDAVESAAIVPYRYLPITTFVLTDTLRPFLVRAGIERDRAQRLADAWTKSLTIQLALWSQPYVVAGDW